MIFVRRFIPVFIFLFCLVFIACVKKTPTVNDWASVEQYEHSNKDLMDRIDSCRVVFMGNSIVNDWAHKKYDFFRENNYINRGLNGQTTAQMLSRFKADVIDIRPAVVVIQAGINDIAENAGRYNEEFTIGNIISMAQLAEANHIKVVLTSVLPANHIFWNKNIKNVPEKINSLNEKIKVFARNNDIMYVDYYSHLVGEDMAMKSEYTSDGIHLTNDGYEVMMPLIKGAIGKVKLTYK